MLVEVVSFDKQFNTLGRISSSRSRMPMYYAEINIKGVLCFIAISQQNTKSADFFVISKIHVPFHYGFPS